MGSCKFIVLEEELEGGRIEVQTLLHAQATADTAGGDVTHDAFNRHHVQTLHQRLVVGQQLFEVGGYPRLLQLGHDEGIELVVDHALARQTFLLLAVEGAGVVAEVQYQAILIIGIED